MTHNLPKDAEKRYENVSDPEFHAEGWECGNQPPPPPQLESRQGQARNHAHGRAKNAELQNSHPLSDRLRADPSEDLGYLGVP